MTLSIHIPATVHALSYSFLTPLILTLLLGKPTIRYLKSHRSEQYIREDGPKRHLDQKKHTPTLGGLLILFSSLVSLILWGRLQWPMLIISLFILITFAAIGFIDDYRKIRFKNSKGMPARYKYALQSLISLIVLSFLYWKNALPSKTHLVLPFLSSHHSIPLGWGAFILGYFVIVGSSNGANLTDGLDGLALLNLTFIAFALGILSYHSHLPYAPELTVLCSSLAGSCLGLLWFNCHPAEIFMGDTGSLALGAILGFVAVALGQELRFFMMSIILVAETLSVILQVFWFRRTGNRIFKMAPLHHHFELAGWSETQVVTRFWLVTLFWIVIALSDASML